MSRPFKAAFGALALGLLTAAIAQSAAHAQADKIRIGYPSGMNGQLPVVMQKAKIAEKHQLDAEFTAFQYGPPMMEGLASGQLDIVVTSFLPPLTLSAKLPGSVRFIAQLGHSSHSLLVAGDSKASQVADLKGRKIGVSFSSESHLDLLLLLKEKGLDAKSDVELVNLQPGELPAAFEKKLVDAVVIRQPQTLRLEQSLGARNIHTWPFPFTCIVRSEYQARNPDAVKRYIEALKDTVVHIAAEPDQSATWFAEALRIDPTVIKKLTNENPLYTASARDAIRIEIDEAFKAVLTQRLDAATSYGFVKGKVDPATVLP
ncbi:MAG: NrtA/SsuA/CpmA family ABC transporter substrate-binding protein [Xanthobacteraceae bacterium]|nr:NrtA/SsuA/CpmA family ABC transporter substrate-binding protein [Xanthobacteraceae bacterium]